MATYEEFLKANAARSGKTAINQRGPDGMFDQVHSRMTNALKVAEEVGAALTQDDHETCSLHDSDVRRQPRTAPFR